jgi:hypothetical protein
LNDIFHAYGSLPTYLNLGDDTLAWLAMSAFRPAVHVVTWARAGTNSLEPWTRIYGEMRGIGDAGVMSDGARIRDENGTEIFRIDRFRFLYYEPFFNMKNCQF